MYTIGEKVILCWNGYSGVARWMHLGRATVIKLNRTRVIVNYQGYEYSVRTDQLRHLPVAEAEPSWPSQL